MQLRIELESLRKEKSDAAKTRREAIEAERSELEARAKEMREQWQREKDAIAGISATREKLDAARNLLLIPRSEFGIDHGRSFRKVGAK